MNWFSDAKDLLFIGLGAVLALYGIAVSGGGFVVPTAFQTAVGFVTAFFDTLGIGSFATTTTAFKLRTMVPVKLMPGTLNVGHTLPTTRTYHVHAALGIALGAVPAVLIAAFLVESSPIGRGSLARYLRRRLHGAEHVADGADRHGRPGRRCSGR
jgi:hypothetical protein